MFVLLLSMVISIFNHGNLHDEIDNYLKEKLSGYDKYEFEIVNVPDASKIRLADNTNLKINGKFIYLPAYVVSKNYTEKKSYLTIKVKLYKYVLAAASDIPGKSTFSQEETVKELADVTNYNGELITSCNGLKNSRYRFFIKKGTILLKEYMEPIPAIKAGDMIKALVRAGNVIVSTKAEARQEGVEGDIIRIITKDKNLFKAKIIDSKNVIIEN